MDFWVLLLHSIDDFDVFHVPEGCFYHCGNIKVALMPLKVQQIKNRIPKPAYWGGGKVFSKFPREFVRYGHNILQRPSPRYLTTFKPA